MARDADRTPMSGDAAAVRTTVVGRRNEPGLAPRAGRAVLAWWFGPVPLARVAVLRAVLYGFVVLDVLFVANDVIPHARVPDLYQPTLLARLLHLPTLPLWGAYLLLLVVVLSCAGAVWGRYPRLAGWAAFASFWWWMLSSQGFGYVSHDHLALMVATLVLPTVGAARYRDDRTSQAAGWALRCVQLAVVLTYFGSAMSKWSRTGSLAAWANGSVFTWAILRRGSDLARWSLEYPTLLRAGQWGLLGLELLSPLAFVLRRRWLWAWIALFLGFHLATFLALGIHFLPTVVCWAAFLPLERLVPVVDRWRSAARRALT